MSQDDDISFDKFIKRHAKQPVRFYMLGVLVEHLHALKRDSVNRTKALEQRLAALEARPSIQDKGVWQCGAYYEPGDIVSRGGSAWICHGGHVSVGDDLSHEHFRLLVKRGRDGRDAR